MSWSVEKYCKLKNTGNVIIVGGTHGAGKSTLCEELKSHLKWDYLSPQKVEEKLCEKISKDVIFKYLLKAVREKVSLGESFIHEHIMSGNFIEKLIQESQSQGFKCHLVFLDIKSEKLALKRVEERVERGGHSVRLEQILAKLIESRYNFWQKYRESCFSWALIDNSSRIRKIISFFDQEDGLEVYLEKEHYAFIKKVGI